MFSCVFDESDVPGAALQAAELFEVENQSSEASKCRMKIAQFSAELERFPVAIEIFESIAKSQVENNLLKYSAKGNLLNAGLCRLNGEDCWNAIGRAIQMKSSSLLSALLCRRPTLCTGLLKDTCNLPMFPCGFCLVCSTSLQANPMSACHLAQHQLR